MLLINNVTFINNQRMEAVGFIIITHLTMS